MGHIATLIAPPCADCGTEPRANGQSYCKGCCRARMRHSRVKHPNVMLVLAAKDKPCVDCGLQLPPAVMELDHVRGVKAFGLASGGTALRRESPERVLAEIAKCDVRCPNCHRMRHWRIWNA